MNWPDRRKGGREKTVLRGGRPLFKRGKKTKSVPGRKALNDQKKKKKRGGFYEKISLKKKDQNPVVTLGGSLV